MTRDRMVSFEEDVIERLARIEERSSSLPDRVRKLEDHRNYLAGIAASLSAVVGYLFHNAH